MDDLEKINKEAVFEKLSGLRVVEETIRCNDLINAISTSIARDKRIISRYTEDEMVTMKVDVNGVLRNCRMFTEAGIARYVQEGKIYSYENVCEYFGINKVNPYDEELVKCLVKDDVFDTKKILKWLYGRRKQSKDLGNIVTVNRLIQWLKKNDDGAIEDRRKYILNMK